MRRSRRSIVIWLSLLLPLSGSFSACLGQADSKLDVIVAGCSHAVSAIHSGTGKVQVDYSGTTKGITCHITSDYAVVFDEGKYSITEVSTLTGITPTTNLTTDQKGLLANVGRQVQRDFMCNGSELIAVNSRLKTALVGELSQGYGRAESVRLQDQCGILGHGVMRLDSNVDPPAKLDHIGVVRTETLDGEECLVVEKADVSPLSNGGSTTLTQMFWVSPGRGYTIPKYQTWVEGGVLKAKALASETDTQTRAYGDGIWGPAKCTKSTYGLGVDGSMQLESTTTTTYDAGFRLNVPIDPDALRHQAPSGTAVYDTTLDAIYASP